MSFTRPRQMPLYPEPEREIRMGQVLRGQPLDPLRK